MNSTNYHLAIYLHRYLRDESGLNRKNIVDNRGKEWVATKLVALFHFSLTSYFSVHCCFYFISPYGHGLKPLDIDFMKQLSNKVKSRLMYDQGSVEAAWQQLLLGCNNKVKRDDRSLKIPNQWEFNTRQRWSKFQGEIREDFKLSDRGNMMFEVWPNVTGTPKVNLKWVTHGWTILMKSEKIKKKWCEKRLWLIT